MSFPPESRLRRSPSERLAFPLDVPSAAEAKLWVQRLVGEVRLFKVGLELFVAEGPSVVAMVHEAGAHCFLDLKLHDIPATVAGAVRSAVRHRVRYLTVHAAGGEAMLRAAAEACAGSETTLLAVSVLTSMDQSELDGIGDTRPLSELVLRRAELAARCGIGGLVCSPAEVQRVRAATELELVVPGIRPEGSDAADQRRVGTPQAALADGADVLVVGRPIRQANDPVEAARNILSAIERSVGVSS